MSEESVKTSQLLQQNFVLIPGASQVGGWFCGVGGGTIHRL